MMMNLFFGGGVI